MSNTTLLALVTDHRRAGRAGAAEDDTARLFPSADIGGLLVVPAAPHHAIGGAGGSRQKGGRGWRANQLGVEKGDWDTQQQQI